MNKVERFEDLRIWQDARILVQQIYGDFRKIRDYSFRDQIQRAGVSMRNWNVRELFAQMTFDF
ncbi:MAG: four helix bundle protein [Kiritimatiellales bacterium]